MWTNFFHSLSLIDISGYLIIAAILLILCISLVLNALVRTRYQLLKRDLIRHQRDGVPLKHQLLRRLVTDIEDPDMPTTSEGDIQTLIECHFSRHYSWALTAERFFKSAAGLMIVLGLVGTFYGLTLSIGKLVALITEDPSGIAEMTSSLTRGLAGALSGMSVAFSTSLVGILSAIAVMIVGVFRGPGDGRNALFLELEVFLSRWQKKQQTPAGDSDTWILNAGTDSNLPLDLQNDHRVEFMNQTADKLQGAVESFGSALQVFSGNVRDFQEFNAHLKDNIQRMSLAFADLSQTLKQHAQTKAERDDQWRIK